MKFSIIIATKNGERFIERCILSILNQSYTNFEIIIQDACSTDSTYEIVHKFKKRLKIESIPDFGIYDAWNRAIERATGEWIIFLGDDDYLASPDVLFSLSQHIKKSSEQISFVYGILYFVKDEVVVDQINRSLEDVYYLFSQKSMGLPFPATCIKRSLILKEPFDISFEITGDMDFCMRTVTSNNISRVEKVISCMETGGISSQMSTSHYRELLKIRKIY